MRRLITHINMTLDGYCDHTVGIADDELHENANDLLRNAGTILFGRKTYRLMEEAWPPMVKNPTGNGPMDEFAILIDNLPKVVFSRTMNNVNWKNTTIATESLEKTVLQLKEQPGKEIVAGSPSLITALLNLGLVDECRFCVHPFIVGKGMQLFRDISSQIDLRLLNTITFASGVVMLSYHPQVREEGKAGKI